MADAIIRRKIIERGMFIFPSFDQLIDRWHIPVGQEYIPRLRPDRLHMIDAVRFLIGPGQFMLLNNIFFIIVHRAAAYQAGLAPSIHDEPVNIIAWLLSAKQDPFPDARLYVLPGVRPERGPASRREAGPL